MKPVIVVENLGKQYSIGRRQNQSTTIRESIVHACRTPFDRLRGIRPAAESTIWALRNVSFEIMPGEVAGVIGRNGAGKSTILKVLSQITEPTTGKAQISGRVGSLLEVGTGFHSELTGRENIYLNGAILGMKRQEIDRKFDEIVSFAEIDQFLDTPVKHYSTGMYMRLAFGVAAHLESEILVVDEVLAVGDAMFQRKCLNKMGEVAHGGRTILFVSHNMAAIESLCSRCLLFDKGHLRANGEPREMISRYFAADEGARDMSVSLLTHPRRTRSSEPIMKAVTCLTAENECTSSIAMSESLKIKVAFASETRAVRPVLGLVIKSATGAAIFGVNNRFVKAPQSELPVRQGAICCSLENLPLMPGSYYVDLYFGDQYRDLDVIEEAVSFEVLPSDVYGTGQLPPASAGPIFWPAKYCFTSH